MAANANETWRCKGRNVAILEYKMVEIVIEEEVQLINSKCHRYVENSDINSFILLLNVKFEDSQL